MEELKTKGPDEKLSIMQNDDNMNTTVLHIPQNDDNINSDMSLSNDETQKDSQEVQNITPSESIDIKTEDANTTNCLALTIQEDHKLVAIKNVFFRSIRMSWKVVVSTITLALIKLFS